MARTWPLARLGAGAGREHGSGPFAREGLLARSAPFLGAMLLAFAVLPLAPHDDNPVEIAAAAALSALIVCTALVAPWSRLPAFAQVVPPLAYFVVIALLRESQGGAGSGYAPLAMLPVFWLALYGTRGQLAVGIAGVAATFLAPLLLLGSPEYPSSEWRRALLWICVAPIVGYTVQRLVSQLRDRASEAAELLERLETTARTDDLTGLPNRRAWDQQLPRELALASRNDHALCVAMLDLDRFKDFNDERGHQAGDRLLKQSAAAWTAQLRSTDMLARYGGEEFSIVLPGCTLEDALRLVERMRAATPTHQTVSAGVACWDGVESAEALVGRADSALYEAKRAGRDRATASV